MAGEAAAGAASSEAGKGAAATGTDAAAAAAAAAAGGDGKGAAGAGDTGKKADDTAAAGSGKKDDAAAAAAAAAAKPPEKYELKLSDGSRLNDRHVARVEQLAKANGWSQEDAALALKEYETNANEEAADWLKDTKADKEFGGDNLQQTQTLATRAVDSLFPEGDRLRGGFKALLKSGAESNLYVLAALARIGKLMSEDRPAQGAAGGGGGAQPRDHAEVLYGGKTK
jgi:hypothetical protein